MSLTVHEPMPLWSSSPSADVAVPGVDVIDIHGALDWRAAGTLRRRVVAAMETAGAIIVDLTYVSAWELAATGAYLMVAVRGLEREVHMAVVARRGLDTDVLTSLGLCDLIPVVDNIAEARAQVTQAERFLGMPSRIFEHISTSECLRTP